MRLDDLDTHRGEVLRRCLAGGRDGGIDRHDAEVAAEGDALWERRLLQSREEDLGLVIGFNSAIRAASDEASLFLFYQA